MPPEAPEESRWYYKLGGRALGPVEWHEIEELLEDAFDPEELLVARVGDDTWCSAKDVIGGAEEEEAESADEAVAEVEEEGPPEPLSPVHGLKPWLSQAWDIFADNPKEYLLGSLITVCLGGLVMIPLPALHAGLYAMALRRFEGEAQQPIGVLGGFRYFSRALGLYALLLLIALPMGFVLLLAAAGVIIALPDDAEFYVVLPTVTLLLWLAVPLAIALPGAAGFFAVPLMIDRDLGVMASLHQSWAVTQRRYLSYVGMTIVFFLVSMVGWMICWVGLVLTLPMLPLAQVCVYRHYFRKA